MSDVLFTVIVGVGTEHAVAPEGLQLDSEGDFAGRQSLLQNPQSLQEPGRDNVL